MRVDQFLCIIDEKLYREAITVEDAGLNYIMAGSARFSFMQLNLSRTPEFDPNRFQSSKIKSSYS